MRGRAVQISAPTFVYRRTGLPRRNVGSGHQLHQEQLGRGQFPIALPPLFHTHRVVLRADVFRFAQFCAIVQSSNPSSPPQALPHLAPPILDHHCVSFLRSACAQRNAQFAQFIVRSSGDSDWLLPYTTRPIRMRLQLGPYKSFLRRRKRFQGRTLCALSDY